ncbi:hypothetical protein FGO68_gene2083 [Halteria grandinella]|uniref:Uncharacterized protein n=1 Tax=Halteria grandinella TaxID=5974 RepID=A0A8J8T2I7_HALGN|nr:hypothetical protein FGO68_gene2083 [Halteria grandinella]
MLKISLISMKISHILRSGMKKRKSYSINFFTKQYYPRFSGLSINCSKACNCTNPPNLLTASKRTIPTKTLSKSTRSSEGINPIERDRPSLRGISSKQASTNQREKILNELSRTRLLGKQS